jgi:Family of unknown function (DUF6440)
MLGRHTDVLRGRCCCDGLGISHRALSREYLRIDTLVIGGIRGKSSLIGAAGTYLNRSTGVEAQEVNLRSRLRPHRRQVNTMEDALEYCEVMRMQRTGDWRDPRMKWLPAVVVAVASLSAYAQPESDPKSTTNSYPRFTRESTEDLSVQTLTDYQTGCRYLVTDVRGITPLLKSDGEPDCSAPKRN